MINGQLEKITFIFFNLITVHDMLTPLFPGRLFHDLVYNKIMTKDTEL